jgi:large subunit ribosomal protein L29
MEEVRDQTDEDLQASLVRTRDELFRLQLGQYTNQVTSTAGLQTKRRDIARLMTVLRGRQLGHEKQAQKQAEAAVVSDDTKVIKKAKKTKAKS